VARGKIVALLGANGADTSDHIADFIVASSRRPTGSA
jgi:hypothetical protein